MSETVKYFWTAKNDDGSFRLGISDTGLDELGKINFVDLPKVGDQLTIGETFMSVEAEKAVSDLPSPVSGTVTHLNAELDDDLAPLNSNEIADRWLLEYK